MNNTSARPTHQIKKIILIVVGVLLLSIVGCVSCTLILSKLLASPEGAACSLEHQCKDGYKCIGKTCSSGKLNSYCESKTDCSTPYCIKNVCKEDMKIGVFVDEDPNDPNNLKEIKIAIITVGMSDGNLTLDPAVGTDIDLTRLNSALAEIKKRPTLMLTSESERIIDGSPALVMGAQEIKKDDPDYVYAVKETLRMEFGFKTEIER